MAVKFKSLLFLSKSLGLSLLLLCCLIAKPLHPVKVFKHKTRVRVVGFENSKRTYKINVPSSYDEKIKVPLVFMFHGGGGNALHMMKTTRWGEKSQKEGFIAVFPEGSKKDEEKKVSEKSLL